MPRANDKQIRGMLLEEAILYLLRDSGYRTVTLQEMNRDKTLAGHAAGLAVHGRGEKHQIDAIADFCVSPPFGYPLRLLLEAKCYATRVGIPTVRNAVGVLKDVSEFWVIPPDEHGGQRRAPHKRYHYQYALFATSSYTKEAQRYAFAQDIFLIPLAGSSLFQPILTALQVVSRANFGTLLDERNSLHRLRMAVRNALEDRDELSTYADATSALRDFVRQVHRIGSAYLATLGGRFTVFLVPTPEWRERVRTRDFSTRLSVQIHFNDTGWFIDYEGIRLFSFDLPEEMVAYFSENGLLDAEQAWELKKRFLKQFQLFHVDERGPQIYWLELDREWEIAVETQRRETRRRSTNRGTHDAIN